jgi:hypothetical protein
VRLVRSRWILVFGACAAVACTSSAGASPAAADITVILGFGTLGTLETTTKTTSQTFGLSAIVEASSTAQEPVRLTIRLGDGLQWGSNAPDAAHGCSGAAAAVCTGKTGGSSSSGNFAFWAWRVTAAGPGTYEVTASVEGEGPDPDTSNNTALFRFQVVSSRGGGGSAKVSAGSVKLAPAKPKAGSTVVASVRVTKGGSPLRPTGVTCAASLGGVKAKGGPKAASGVASCVFKTPKSAKGKSLAGSISFRAGGSAFTKRFAVRLR